METVQVQWAGADPARAAARVREHAAAQKVRVVVGFSPVPAHVSALLGAVLAANPRLWAVTLCFDYHASAGVVAALCDVARAHPRLVLLAVVPNTLYIPAALASALMPGPPNFDVDFSSAPHSLAAFFDQPERRGLAAVMRARPGTPLHRFLRGDPPLLRVLCALVHDRGRHVAHIA